MVVIDKGTSSSFLLNLTTKKRVANSPYVFMKLTNDMTKEDYFVYPSETVEPRYSTLTITEGVDVTLGAEGFYTYVIYQVNDNTLTDDSTLSTSRIIERGKAKVNDASVTEVSYTQYTPTDNTNTLNNNTQYINI